MYGKSPIEFPRRVVCLTAETTEIAFMVGAAFAVVGAILAATLISGNESRRHAKAAQRGELAPAPAAA